MKKSNVGATCEKLNLNLYLCKFFSEIIRFRLRQTKKATTINIRCNSIKFIYLLFVFDRLIVVLVFFPRIESELCFLFLFTVSVDDTSNSFTIGSEEFSNIVSSSQYKVNCDFCFVLIQMVWCYISILLYFTTVSYYNNIQKALPYAI